MSVQIEVVSLHGSRSRGGDFICGGTSWPPPVGRARWGLALAVCGASAGCPARASELLEVVLVARMFSTCMRNEPRATVSLTSFVPTPRAPAILERMSVRLAMRACVRACAHPGCHPSVALQSILAVPAA